MKPNRTNQGSDKMIATQVDSIPNKSFLSKYQAESMSDKSFLSRYQVQLPHTKVESTPDTSFLSKYQVQLPKAITAMGSKHSNVNLTENYQVGPNDVVCGRGKGSYMREGNKKFRSLVRDHVEEYVRAKTKLDKSMVLSSIVDKVREQFNGRFIKKQKGCWYEIGDELAREKVGHAIREAIAAGEKKPSPSSTPAAAAKASHNPEAVHSDFQAKHSDLLSRQVSFFQGLVARSNSPANSCSSDLDVEEESPCHFTPGSQFQW